MSILKFIIPKAHICFYICSQIKYYLKKNYLYYYFIILFLEFANCFQLFISSIPIYVVHIYMQPKYVTQSQFWLPFVLYVMKPTTSHPHPSPLLHTSLTITQDLQPHWVLCFSSDIIKYLCLFSVTQYSWRSQRWVGGIRVGDVGWA